MWRVEEGLNGERLDRLKWEVEIGHWKDSWTHDVGVCS